MDHLQSSLRQLETKLFSAEQSWADLEGEYKKREVVSHEFIQSLQKEIYDLQQVSFKKKEKKDKHLVNSFAIHSPQVK